MRFRDFITEEKEVHHVFAFGRMSPPTTGHEVLVNKVHEVAEKHKAGHSVVLSHTQDKDKNPLSGADKLKHAKRFFPKTNLSTSSKEHPNFLSHAEKLHKQGVTHLHMVAGSDRTSEYHTLLHKYNGEGEGKLFNFKKITVHNAGERDPDAEGTAGMSASKMRAHAKSGNFAEFKKGIPNHVDDKHAKEMFHDVRKGMQIKEDLNEEFEMLLEGVHDQGIFKAVFLAGGPGSGKDYVLSNVLDGHGLVEINSDKALEYLMDKEGLDKLMPSDEKEKRDLVRGRAKNITELRQRLALLGRNGLIINGTGDDPEKVKRIKDQLEQLGYESSMLLVNTQDDISAQRNIERGQRGGRAVPETIRKEKWDAVQNARTEYAKMFGNNYMEFDNSEDLREAPPEVVRAKKQEMLQLFSTVKNFVSSPPQNDEAKFWTANELDKKDTLPIPSDGAEKVPSHGDPAAEDARRLGLQYYGFGRYGRNGKVTHRSVHGSLVAVTKEEPKQPKIPISSSSQKTIKESVTVSITGDTAEEVNQMFQMMQQSASVSEKKQEQYQFSDTKDVITLGQKIEPFGQKLENITFTMNDVLEEANKLMKDSTGKVRVFLLRASAAKEAHRINGTVLKHKNGYVVKLNEETNHVKLSKEDVRPSTDSTTTKPTNGHFVEASTGEERRTSSRSIGTVRQILAEGRTSPSSTRTSASPNTGTKGQTRTEAKENNGSYESKKITITEIRQRKKEKINESIDKGIEPGLSMATSGENYGRDAIRRKPLKKPLEELTGDTTTMSIGDQKEDELKKKGISLQSFKAKKFVG